MYIYITWRANILPRVAAGRKIKNGNKKLDEYKVLLPE